MLDDPIRRAFDLLDQPPAPSSAFTDALFERLVQERKRRQAVTPLHRTLPPQRPKLWRILAIAAALLLALVIFAIVVIPLGNLGRAKQPAEPFIEHAPATIEPFSATIVGRFENPNGTSLPMRIPEFAPGTVPTPSYTKDRGGTFRLKLDYQGRDAWRIDLLGGNELGLPLINAGIGTPGSYAIWDGELLSSYPTGKDEYTQQLHVSTFSPLNLLGIRDPMAGWRDKCSNGPRPGVDLGEEALLGRPVRHLQCSTWGSLGDHVDLWVDVDTGLILRIRSNLPTPVGKPSLIPGPFNFFPGLDMRMTSLEYNPQFAPGAFTFTPPAGAHCSSSQSCGLTVTAPSTLTIGEAAPSWTGPLLSGGTFDLASTRGRPTIVSFWIDSCGCGRGSTLLDAIQDAYGIRANEVNIVTVAGSADVTTERSVRSYVADNGYGFPVIYTGDNSIGNAWGINLERLPTVVLLDAEGRFVGAYGGWTGNSEIGSKDDVSAIMDALVSGTPLPHLGAFSIEQTG
jgi:AhpC/TSA family